jgi:hypothetical protein
VTTQLSVSALFSVETVARWFARGLEVGQALGLATSSWRDGDPTQTAYYFIAEALGSLEGTKSEFIKAGFLSSAVEAAVASGDSTWLKILALEVYGVEAVEATYATPTLELTNSGARLFEIAAGDITVKSSTSGKTFHNTTAATLTPVGTSQISDTEGPVVSIDFVADEAGSDSSVAEDEIDEIVTTMLNVAITASTVALATDEQSPEAIAEQCRATLGALSPNGPPDAYEYVVRNPGLTGVTDITRAHTVDDSDTGDVTVYVAGPSGAVAGASITAAQDAVEEWATPHCITPTVVNATGVTVNVTATITGDDIPAGFESTIEDALELAFADFDIGEDVFTSAIIAEIHAAIPQIKSVTLTLPAATVTIEANEVPILGTVTIVEA